MPSEKKTIGRKREIGAMIEDATRHKTRRNERNHPRNMGEQVKAIELQEFREQKRIGTKNREEKMKGRKNERESEVRRDNKNDKRKGKKKRKPKQDRRTAEQR